MYFITEFINGGELFSHIRKRGKLSADAAKFISVEVACALQSVHDYGVVYRGVKPENIMIGIYLSHNYSGCTINDIVNCLCWMCRFIWAHKVDRFWFCKGYIWQLENVHSLRDSRVFSTRGAGG